MVWYLDDCRGSFWGSASPFSPGLWQRSDQIASRLKTCRVPPSLAEEKPKALRQLAKTFKSQPVSHPTPSLLRTPHACRWCLHHSLTHKHTPTSRHKAQMPFFQSWGKLFRQEQQRTDLHIASEGAEHTEAERCPRQVCLLLGEQQEACPHPRTPCKEPPSRSRPSCALLHWLLPT